ncbi:MAG: hypothetical protein Q8Q42_04010 [Nanoarchaeota archaeon]|nr:hypothetical protein [Nanoarchaeota archaeon]
MGERLKREVKKELVFVLLVLCMFVVLVVTWGILDAVDSITAKSGRVFSNIPSQGSGQVALSILSEDSVGDGG